MRNRGRQTSARLRGVRSRRRRGGAPPAPSRPTATATASPTTGPARRGTGEHQPKIDAIRARAALNRAHAISSTTSSRRSRYDRPRRLGPEAYDERELQRTGATTCRECRCSRIRSRHERHAQKVVPTARRAIFRPSRRWSSRSRRSSCLACRCRRRNGSRSQWQSEHRRIIGIVDTFYGLLVNGIGCFTGDFNLPAIEHVVCAEDASIVEARLIEYYKTADRIAFCSVASIASTRDASAYWLQEEGADRLRGRPVLQHSPCVAVSDGRLRQRPRHGVTARTACASRRR